MSRFLIPRRPKKMTIDSSLQSILNPLLSDPPSSNNKNKHVHEINSSSITNIPINTKRNKDQSSVPLGDRVAGILSPLQLFIQQHQQQPLQGLNADQLDEYGTYPKISFQFKLPSRDFNSTQAPDSGIGLSRLPPQWERNPMQLHHWLNVIVFLFHCRISFNGFCIQCEPVPLI